MIDERFSAAAFEGLSDRDSRIRLEGQLEDAIVVALQPTLESAVAAIVARLNELGHSLEQRAQDETQTICYDDGDSDAGTLRLRICHDSIATAMWRGSAA